MLTCRALLFDLDGVLVDSTACVEKHWQLWAARHGLNAGLILAHSHGRRTIDTMRLVASHLDLDLTEEAARLEEEEARDLEGIIALPGAVELVTALPAERWAIVTSATRGMAAARLKAVGLPIPHAFVTAEKVSQGKPHPEGYLLAASLLETVPADCLVIEDAPAGLEAAHAGGIRALGVTTTFPADTLQVADWIVRSLEQVKLDTTRKYDDGLLRFTLTIGSTKS